MIIWNIEVLAKRWPWQDGYSWRGMTNSTAPLNAGGARFGGGWKYKLGIAVGGSTVMVDLLFGMLTFSKVTRCKVCGDKINQAMKNHNFWHSAHKRCLAAKNGTLEPNAVQRMWLDEHGHWEQAMPDEQYVRYGQVTADGQLVVQKVSDTNWPNRIDRGAIVVGYGGVRG